MPLAQKQNIEGRDLALARKDFPILRRTVNGNPLVYLDSAATSQKPQIVIDTVRDFYAAHNANVHRSLHTLSSEATEHYEAVRDRVVALIHAPSRRSVVFVKSTTEAINLVAYSYGARRLTPGSEIVLSVSNHHSNFVPWQAVAQRTGAELRVVELGPGRHLRWEDLADAISTKTKIVAISHKSNVLGTLLPVERIVEVARRHGAVVVVDGAQSAPHTAVDVQALGCDFLAFSAHKMLGPTGVGVLYGREDLLEEMDPFLYGGEMISEVTLEGSTWHELPWKFEGGTPNIAGVVGFGAAIDYLEGIGWSAIESHEQDLTRYTTSQLQKLRQVSLYMPEGEYNGIVSFNLGDVHPHDVATLLDEEGVAVRAGHHCAQPLMRELGVAATVRASFYLYNTREEVDRFIAAVQRAAGFFGVN